MSPPEHTPEATKMYATRTAYQHRSSRPAYNSAPASPRPASDKQIAFLNSLLVQLGHAETVTDEQRAALTTATASQLIDALKQQVDAKRAQRPETPEGFHFFDGQFFRVKRGQAGHLYALVHNGHDWEYVGRAPLANLSPETVLTAEQAAEFGHRTGSCIYCGRELSDERSVEVGYGPICAKKHGLPWG